MVIMLSELLTQLVKRIYRVSRPFTFYLNCAQREEFVFGDREPYHFDPDICWRYVVIHFEPWITCRNKEHAFQRKANTCFFGYEDVSDMDRIERAPKDTYSHVYIYTQVL